MSTEEKHRVKKKLDNFKKDIDDSMEDHIGKFNKLILKINNMNINVDEHSQCLNLLDSLPRSYDEFIERRKDAADENGSGLQIESLISKLKRTAENRNEWSKTKRKNHQPSRKLAYPNKLAKSSKIKIRINK